MAPKRGAPKGPRGRPPKQQKVDKPAAAETPYDEAIMAILDVVGGDAGVTAAAHESLSAVVPFCLREPKAERHEFQTRMALALREVLGGVVVGGKTAVAEAEGQVAEISGRQTIADEEVKATRLKESELATARDAAKRALDEASTKVAAAKEALKRELEKNDGLQAEHKNCLQEKAEREVLVSETWGKLKEGAWEKGQWRARNKAIDNVVHVLQALDVEESLQVALPIGLKTKADERKIVATEAIQLCDEYLTKSVAALAEKIDELASSDQMAAVAAAEESVAAALTWQSEKTNETIDAENVLLAATEAHKEAAGKVKELALEGAKQSAELTKAQAALENIMLVVSRFEALFEGGEAVLTAVPEEAVTAAPAQEEKVTADVDIASPEATKEKAADAEVAPAPLAEAASTDVARAPETEAADVEVAPESGGDMNVDAVPEAEAAEAADAEVAPAPLAEAASTDVAKALETEAADVEVAPESGGDVNVDSVPEAGAAEAADAEVAPAPLAETASTDVARAPETEAADVEVAPESGGDVNVDSVIEAEAAEAA